MKFLKAAAAGAMLLASAIGAQAQNAEPVRLTTYTAFTESYWGMELSLRSNGKATLLITDNESKKKAKPIAGTWVQEGDKLKVKFGGKTLNQVYRIKAQNNIDGWACKVMAYGLKPLNDEAGSYGNQLLWADVKGKDSPCVK